MMVQCSLLISLPMGPSLLPALLGSYLPILARLTIPFSVHFVLPWPLSFCFVLLYIAWPEESHTGTGGGGICTTRTGLLD
ncbi:hypothetical protein V8F20_000006 [Naviculisporaceae sp. PSN 640]